VIGIGSMKAWLWSLSLCLLLPLHSLVAQVNTELSPQSGTVLDRFDLNVILDATSARGFATPSFPSNESFTFQFAGRESSMQIVNGNMSHSIIYRFQVTPAKSLTPGKYRLPDGTITIDRENLTIPGLTVEITAQPAAGNSAADGVRFSQELSSKDPFVGEQILYTAQITASGRIANPQFTPLDAPGMWKEGFGKESVRVRAIGGGAIRVIEERYALYPTITGAIAIPARAAELQVAVPARRRRAPDPFGFGGGMFGGMEELFDLDPFYDTQQINLQAAGVTINVRPLPPAPKAGVKYIPVGKVSLASALSSDSARQGDSVTLVIELYGDANLRPLELPEASQSGGNFRIYPDKPVVELLAQEQKIFQKKTFRIDIVPQASGKLTLPQFEFVVFDPSDEKYELLRTPPRELVVEPSPNFIAEPQDPSTSDLVSGEDSLSTSESEKQSANQEPLARPNRQNAEESGGMRRFSPALFVALLFLPLIMTACWSYWESRRRVANSRPEQLIARRAATRALARLKTVGQAEFATPDELDRILRTYLEERFNHPFKTLTPAECGSELGKFQLAKATASERITTLLGQLESARYSPVSSSTAPATVRIELHAAVCAIVLEIEREAKFAN